MPRITRAERARQLTDRLKALAAAPQRDSRGDYELGQTVGYQRALELAQVLDRDDLSRRDRAAELIALLDREPAMGPGDPGVTALDEGRGAAIVHARALARSWLLGRDGRP